MNALKEPSVKVQSAVASALALSGMWHDAHDILLKIHSAAVQEKKLENSLKLVQSDRSSALAELPKLHLLLLKACADNGNIKTALSYVDEIQTLTKELSHYHNSTLFSNGISLNEKQSSEADLDKGAAVTSITITSPGRSHRIGMKGDHWKLVMCAASKQNHCTLCNKILLSLRPFVEQTHPHRAIINEESNLANPLSSNSLFVEYKKLSFALTSALLAFETSSKDSWAIRAISAIDDWIKWSGRRPNKESFHSACRMLASQGHGNEVISLLERVLIVPPCADTGIRMNDGKFPSYENAIYTAAITSLHKNGLYDSADELYARAMTEGFLPWPILEDEDNPMQLKLDLHGMSLAIAHAAVRVSLQQFGQSAVETSKQDVIIVTGRGKRSFKYLRPCLRPEVQRMLLEEFYPPLSTASIPGNMGALIIPSTDVAAWNKYQYQQKGKCFIKIASILKSISCGNRLQKALEMKLKHHESLYNN